MKRVITTSQGLISVDVEPNQRLGPMKFGFSATVDIFDTDGWEIKGKTWMPGYIDSSLGDFLASFVDLPSEEADALALEIQGTWIDEWRARGGEEEEHELRRFTNRLLAVVAVVAGLAITGIVLAIWLLST